MTDFTVNGAVDKRGERGAVLLMALVFIFVLGFVFVALGGFAANAMLNTSNLHAQRTATEDAEAVTVASMQYLRTNFTNSDGTFLYNLSTKSCPGTGTTIPSSNPQSSGSISVVLACIAQANPVLSTSRTVDFYVCKLGTALSACPSATGPNLLLHAQAQYNDINTSGMNSCSSSSTATCGTSMTVSVWDVTGADN